MSEQFDALSDVLISTLQKSLRRIRQSLELGVQKLADLIGVTRQTVNNLESQKSQMSVTQFVAVCSVIDHYTENNPQLRKIIYQFLMIECGSDYAYINLFEAADAPLLKMWFALFEDDEENVCDFKYLVENCRIFLDDTILAHPLFESAAKSLFDLAAKNRSSFIVPYRAVEVVCGYKEHVRSESGMKLLEQLKFRNILLVKGEESDSNVADTIVSVFDKFRNHYKLALFTQNNELADRLLTLDKDSFGYEIQVYRLEPDGRFRPYELTEKAPDTDFEDDRDYLTGADYSEDFTDDYPRMSEDIFEENRVEIFNDDSEDDSEDIFGENRVEIFNDDSEDDSEDIFKDSSDDEYDEDDDSAKDSEECGSEPDVSGKDGEINTFKVWDTI